MRRTFAFNLARCDLHCGRQLYRQDGRSTNYLLPPSSPQCQKFCCASPFNLPALEYVLPFFLLALLVALKVIYAFAFRIDSDETQHLHVVWGWVNGLLPYRDLFDNHSPLFQFICSPLFRALGERADIVIPMRLAMIPLYFFSL
jgi:hypothetical protein